MSNFSDEMVSSQKIRRDIKSGKLLLSLFTLGGRVTLFKSVNKDMYKKISDLERKIDELLLAFEVFNSTFSDYGWIAYESINVDVINEANKILRDNGIEEAERFLIKFYSNDIEKYLYILKRNQEFAIRYELICAAFEEHKNKKFYNSIPIFLMMIDGAVSDYAKTGFAADKTDVQAWDSMVGHSQGLGKLKEIYTRNRTKTTIDSIYLPYRNGILHGRDINYANEYVSCKALGMIFAVNDWITAKKTEESRKAEYIKSTKEKSWNEVFDNMRRIDSQKRLIQQWRPRNIVIGKDIPSTGLPSDFESGSPEETVAIFMNLWSKKNYGNMVNYLGLGFFHEKSTKKRAGTCREIFGNKELKGYQISSIEDRAAATTVITVKVSWVTNGVEFNEKLTFGIIYCSKDDEPLVRGQSGGRWIMNGWDITALYR